MLLIYVGIVFCHPLAPGDCKFLMNNQKCHWYVRLVTVFSHPSEVSGNKKNNKKIAQCIILKVCMRVKEDILKFKTLNSLSIN